MFNTYSKSGQLSAYDFASTLRDIGLIIVSFVAVNIDLVNNFVEKLGLDPLFAAFIIFFCVEIARKFNKNYAAEIPLDTSEYTLEEINNLK